MIERLIFLLLALSVTVNAQSNAGIDDVSNLKTYQGGPIRIDYLCDEKPYIRLTVQNDTGWALALMTDDSYYSEVDTVKLQSGRSFSALPSNKKISVQYRIDKFARPDENVKVPSISYSDSGSVSWIAPKHSIQFAVPANYLKSDLLVFVRFNYEWELPAVGTFSTMPEHRLLFRGIDLPDKRQTCKP